jgi:hypothetical protein
LKTDENNDDKIRRVKMGPMFQNLEFLFDMAFLKIPLEISCLWLFSNRFGLAVVSEKKIAKGT